MKDCPVCHGSGLLALGILDDLCPMCEHNGENIIVRTLGGEQLSFTLEADVTFEDIKSIVCTGIQTKHACTISSEGGILYSVEQLLEHHHQGHALCVVVQRKKVCDMSMCEIREELMMSCAEFRSHFQILRRHPAPKDVFEYLWENGLFLTPCQAFQVFDAFAQMRNPYTGYFPQNLHDEELISALHTLCLEPFANWSGTRFHESALASEYRVHPDDRQLVGNDDITTPSDERMKEGVGMAKGQLTGSDDGVKSSHERLKEEEAGKCKGGCGYYAGPDGYCSACSSTWGVEVRRAAVEVRRTLMERDPRDPTDLRGALKALRDGDKVPKPAYPGNISWC